MSFISNSANVSKKASLKKSKKNGMANSAKTQKKSDNETLDKTYQYQKEMVEKHKIIQNLKNDNKILQEKLDSEIHQNKQLSLNHK